MNGYFYGWYFKCQSDTQTLAVIPAVHGAGRERTCSIQFITEESVRTVTFPGEMFCKKGERICIGENQFGKNGLRLNIEDSQLNADEPEEDQESLSVKGRLRFAALTPIKYDIMGPFTFVPYMECRHSVYSMCHRVDGRISINDKEYVFQNALGYWEGDRGRSFPKKYAWTQCFFPNGSLMLSVADIPLPGIHFTGIIGVVFWKGKEYRLATYLGARAVQKRDRMLLIRQGSMELEARLLESAEHPLKAPTNGDMSRTIYESATCKAFYRFRIQGSTVFSFTSDKASFEYEY